jgi:hypothetical protein
MTRQREDLDYLLYRIYVWAGLAALVIYIASLLLTSDVGQTARLDLIAVPIILWVLGILAYWWWLFLVKETRALEESCRRRPESTPAISALKNWSTLHAAMAAYGGDVDAILEADRAARRPVIIWYGAMNLLVLWILCGFWVFFRDDSLQDRMGAWGGGVLVIMILFVVVAPWLLSRAGAGGEAAYLAPLGLAPAEPPAVEPPPPGIPGRGYPVRYEGASVLHGSRRGRPVHVETIGRRSYTFVAAEMPPFEIHSQAGKLLAGEGAPGAVTRALKGMRKAKRWTGIAVKGGPEGIGIERESRGRNMWLYDLWLVERLLDRWNDEDA